jgi:outer membrane protein OmpA-like peptidoglycan-associated protein
MTERTHKDTPAKAEPKPHTPQPEQTPLSVAPSIENILMLQRLIGNQAVGRMMGASRIQRDGPTDEGRGLFDIARQQFDAGQYSQALVTFERVREVGGAPERVRRDCTYNIGLCNLRLRRFATATLYFEQYLAMSGADTALGQSHLDEARAGAGTSATDDPAAQLTEDQARDLFRRTTALFDAGDYRQAIVGYERLRQFSDTLGDEVRRDSLHNIGVCNLRLGRFSTAVLYFELYMAMAGADVARAQERLAEAYEGMGTAPGTGQHSVERDWESANPAGGVERNGRRLVLWNFAVGSSALKPEHVAALRAFLTENNVAFLDIATYASFTGHASSSGSETINLGVAMERAAAAQMWAATSSGLVGMDRTLSFTEGESNPRYPNTSPENMARNRRIEIEIVMRPQPEPAEEPEPPAPPPGETPTPEVEQRYQNFSIRMISGGEGGEVVGGGMYTFEIKENRPGGNSVMYTFTGIGITGGMPAGAYGPSTWSDFTTAEPMRLEDFEGGGRIAAAGVYIGGGGGLSVLVFYCGDLPEVQVEGFGAGTGAAAGASWFHGWWELRD